MDIKIKNGADRVLTQSRRLVSGINHLLPKVVIKVVDEC